MMMMVKIQCLIKHLNNYISMLIIITLDLPEYSTTDIIYERLNYATTNCSSIDGDGAINDFMSIADTNDDVVVIEQLSAILATLIERNYP
jgi:hypothetical protein